MFFSKLDVSYIDGTSQSNELYYVDMAEFNNSLPQFLSLIHINGKSINCVKITCSKVSEL